VTAPYVILASKPGQFSTEPGPGIEPVEAWEYHFGGQLRARFVVARLLAETRIAITDEAPPWPVNRIPTKLLARFGSLEAARAELSQLSAHVAGAEARLTRVPL
jgi:hypothetical protein